MIKEKLIVGKSGPLNGTIRIDGAKNAVLPIIAATILATEKCYLEEVPDLRDVNVMCEVIESIGAKVSKSGNGTIEISVPVIESIEAPYELVQKMRASFYVMGALLARTGEAKIPLPGGCAIGARPIDLHLKGFSALGAEIEMGRGFVYARAKKLVGASIYLDFPSVGATENIMMAATMAEGCTVIENAATEPEISDLANFLNEMGANIKGAGTDTIRITGVKKLGGARHTVIPDRIEAGTFMIMVAAAGGDVTIENVMTSHLKPAIAKLKECGVKIVEEEDSVRIISDGNLAKVDITTLPYPGFPTDLQAQFMALLTVSKGTSVVMETVFENRFMHVSELLRMGANIKIEGHSAIVQGVDKLQGAKVKATDLRAGAALIIAGILAEGETEIFDLYHIDRGYVNIEEKLRNIGVKIERTTYEER